MVEFAGFTDQQLYTLAKQKGYTGRNHTDEVNAFIMGNDQAKTYVVDMYNQATTLVGRQRRGFAPGGLSDAEIAALTPEEALDLTMKMGGANIKYRGGQHGDYSDLDTFQSYSGWEGVAGGFDTWKKVATQAGLGQKNITSSNQNFTSGAVPYGAWTMSQADIDGSSGGDGDGSDGDGTDGDGSGEEGEGSETTPEPKNYAKLATTTPVSVISVPEGDKTLIDKGGEETTPGQIEGIVSTPDTNPSIGDAKTAGVPSLTPTADGSAVQVADKVDSTLGDVQAAKGTVSDEAQVDAQTMDTDDLAQTKLDAAQIDEAQTVKAPNKRTIQDGETVQSAYDQNKVDKVIAETEASYAEADPSEKALVQGQLTDLMKDFEDGKTPPWAAGAMRTALAAMNARGLSASSLAGQAIVQAAMESALPIATADASTVAKFEMQNLNNRQQATILAAEQRATFLGQEFDMEFQARVKNASTISEIARQNYDAEVQIALENARMAQTVDIANLDATNAKILSDAAAMTKLDITNLTNKQQAEVANAKAFLDMDMKNLDNQQQMNLFKGQAKMDALFKDQAEMNAMTQFNIQEKNKVNIALANIQAAQARFNAEQQNAMKQLEFSEKQANDRFASSLKENRAQFNAENALAVAQADAQWHQAVTTQNNAAINQANMNDANNATAMTKMQLEQDFQAARDVMNWAFTADQNDQQRAASIAIAQMDADAKTANGTSSLFQTVLGVVADAINPLS